MERTEGNTLVNIEEVIETSKFPTIKDCFEYLYSINQLIKSKILVEIGVGNFGGSNIILLKYCKDYNSFLFSIDIKDYPNIRKRNEILGLTKYWKFIVSDSREFKINFNFDFLFIDGGHEYEIVFDDLNKFSQYMNPKGVIVLHDTRLANTPQIHEEVRKAMFAFLNNHKEFYIVEYPTERGLTVLFKYYNLLEPLLRILC